MKKKIKEIVLDTDVIIHFIEGDNLLLLPRIFPDYVFVVLDVVMSEAISRKVKNQLQRIANCMPQNFKIAQLTTMEEMKEYAQVISKKGQWKLGEGESACMVYCRFHKEVVGSSNLKDLPKYCEQYGITYITTIDILYYGIKRCVIDDSFASNFIAKVKAQGSRLPNNFDFNKYSCDKIEKFEANL